MNDVNTASSYLSFGDKGMAMRKHLTQASLLIGLVVLVVWLINLFVGKIFPAGLNQQILLLTGIILACLAAISGFKDAVELFHLISEKKVETTPLPPSNAFSFLIDFISAYRNTRIVWAKKGKTHRFFHNNLFITLREKNKRDPLVLLAEMRSYEHLVSYAIGSPGRETSEVHNARLGDSVIYEAQDVYDIRIAEISGYNADSVKFIIVRSHSQIDGIMSAKASTQLKENK
jgi:hypothetical protein